MRRARHRAAIGVCAAYAGSVAVRLWLARAAMLDDPPIRMPRNDSPEDATAPACEPVVTVLQPILSGDPLLAELLAENADGHPDARFRWLVDEDDPLGQQICRHLAETRAHVEVVLFPPVEPGANPKVFKLARALRRAPDGAEHRTDAQALPDELIAVLDDDTVLPPGALRAAVAALDRGDLVTGLPCYRSGSTLWSRLVAGFVNGNAAISYLPLARLAPPVTINGMFYLTRRDTLERLGGFAAIERSLCDDLELARLYRRAGGTIVQSTVTHPLATTVPDLTSYLRLQRRWMVFAGRLFAEQPEPRTIGLVALPSLLPLTAAVLAVGDPVALAAVGVTVAGKALALAALRRKHLGTTESPATIAAEIVADLIQPAHAAAGFVRPRRIQWRTRSIRLDGDGVTYT